MRNLIIIVQQDIHKYKSLTASESNHLDRIPQSLIVIALENTEVICS